MKITRKISKIKIPPEWRKISNYTPSNLYALVLTIVLGIMIAIITVIAMLAIPQKIKVWWEKRKERL